MMNHFLRILAFMALFLPSTLMSAQNPNFADNYFYGRDYYLIKSGRAKMIVQCDKADVGPAFKYMLFDGKDITQTKKKANAFNYSTEDYVNSTAVEILMNDYPLTALSYNTETTWDTEDGIPAFKGTWWAGGFKITETIIPASDDGIFRRRICVKAEDIVGNDSFSLRLTAPFEGEKLTENSLTYQNTYKESDATITLVLNGSLPLKADSKANQIETMPIMMHPEETRIIDSYIIVDIPRKEKEQLLQRIANLNYSVKSSLKAVSKSWDKYCTIETDDELVKKIYEANRNSLIAHVSDVGKTDSGIFQYGAQWVRDASNTTIGLIHIGAFDLARKSLVNIMENMITENGTTMIANSFDEPDREQFDQMGEYMHALKYYVDWTGDNTLVSEYKDKLLKMIERPLLPYFRDKTGMVHNHREFWERTFEDAYELAYQTWVIKGLEDAAALSEYFENGKRKKFWQKKAEYWLNEAEIFRKSMLEHSKKGLVEDGHLIKRRNITGEVARIVNIGGYSADSPAALEQYNCAYPDASMALPISLEIIDPKSELARNTLDELEALWNQRWFCGGYERYNISSQADAPGPWGFATTFIMRAQHESGLYDRSRRALQWLYEYCGGKSGCLYEEVPVLKSQGPNGMCGLIPWTSAEIAKFIIRHMMGFKFNEKGLMYLQPKFFDQTNNLEANLRFRNDRIEFTKEGKGKFTFAIVNGKRMEPNKEGIIQLPGNFEGGSIKIIYQ